MMIFDNTPSQGLTVVTLAQPIWFSCANGPSSSRMTAGQSLRRDQGRRQRKIRGQCCRAPTVGPPDDSVGDGGDSSAARGNSPTTVAATGPRGRRSTRTARTRRPRMQSVGTCTWTRDRKMCPLAAMTAVASTSRWPLT